MIGRVIRQCVGFGYAEDTFMNQMSVSHCHGDGMICCCRTTTCRNSPKNAQVSTEQNV